ncbi:MAG: bifunctional 3-phenylpropionate/cinnamic acid dioxygenase ferredoxin subunit [Candidatus Dormibacteraeota bacterium]|nr:bifunctional 3-phenylpropionate/cinnamic acid dioxygenase ferredoxin subunit [Candidatus Dormibacteraeota bacterium]
MSVATWVEVGRIEDVPPGHAARVEIDEVPVAIFNLDGEFFCLDDTCSHAEASLSDGDLDTSRCAIECPLHGSAFSLRTGDPLSLPAVEPVRVHRVDTTDGVIRVALGEEPR